jgi:hypothetical protein
MRTRIILLGAVAFAAFALGTRFARPAVKERESVGHQLVRELTDPKARRRRRHA